ncbi:MAG: T9SS C-terminal target domain-containing protein, partial [Crocinitomicaceae bacterium]|nr:T9SS C-terminal target domain-containing protein [Crocinitomicaceae bacterium]
VYTGTTTNCVTEFLNLTITPSSTNTLSITACGSYVWNGTTYASSGVYTGTTTNCITQSLNLTIIPPDTNTVNVDATPSFFWVFTAQIYTVSGTYQFLDLNNCVLEILNLSLTNDIAEESSNAFTIFPNPTNGNVVISLFSDDQCRLNVYDSQGQLVFENPSISNGEEVNLSDYSPGVYIFRVYTSNQIYTRRIIKN